MIGKNWIYADNILSQYDRKRKAGEVTFYTGRLTTVAHQGDYYAHVKDMRSALLDLRFKMANRDKSQYDDLTLESVLSYEDAIIMYRVITGACQQGTNQFLEQFKPKERDYTIAEIIELTEGQYGSKVLQDFFKGERK